MVRTLATWQTTLRDRERLCAVETRVVDRNYLLREIVQMAENVPVHFWNPGAESLCVASACDRFQVRVRAESEQFASYADFLRWVETCDREGVFVVEGLLAALTPTLKQRIEHLYFHLQQTEARKHLVLLDENGKVPVELHPMLPQLAFPPPQPVEVREQVERKFWSQLDWDRGDDNRQRLRPVVGACTGLARAEIEIALDRALLGSDDPDAIAASVLAYKQQRLAGRGVTILPPPDVPVAAGLDVLDECLDEIAHLLTPEATARGLRPPKGMLLWGIPGTGKSLAAKLAAQRIGGLLVAADWNGLLGESAEESLANLDALFEFVDNVGPAILFMDELDKGFCKWDESGTAGKLAAKLLTWLNDHESPVVFLATINHVEKLPPEMIRRFEKLFFFPVPHAGALHQAFTVHLDKFFEYDFTEREWHLLLREYRGCTPAEVMKAVRAVANRRLIRDLHDGVAADKKPTLTLEELLEERRNFTPDSEKRDVSDAIAGILNKADYAQSVQGPDTSIFADPPSNLFGLDDASATDDGAGERKPLLQTPMPEVEEI